MVSIPTPLETLIIPSEYGDPNAMFALSQDLIHQTETYVNTIIASTANLIPPRIDPIFPTVTTPPVPVQAAPPNLINVAWDVPNQPNPFSEILNINNLLPGPFQGQPPSLSFPPRPNPFDVLVPAAPVTNLNFTYPTLSVTLPSPPQLYTLDTVNFNIGQIPTFNATVPALTLQAPNPIPYVEGSMYTSALLTSLQNSLQDTIDNGTNLILPQEIERGIWERARDKEYRQTADSLMELDRMEVMGFALPSGVWLDSRLKIITELGYTTSTLNRDAAIEQTKLAVQNLNSAREQAVNLERAFIDYANSIAQRQLEAAKYLTEASISIYNAQVEQYKAALEGYRVQALVYETQIKGILAQVEVIKAEIEYEQVKAQINTALIEQYKAMIQAAQITVEIYNAQLHAIEIQAQVEKIKVDIFGAQIQAYVGQVNAYTGQVEAYKAEVEAQGVIEQVYKTQVDAYVATVQAGVAEVNALVSKYDADVKAYTTQLEGYKAALEAMVEQARAASLYNQASASVYGSLSTALASYNEVLTKQWQAVLSEQMQVAQIGVSAAQAQGQMYIATEGLILDASKTGAQAISQLGAASLGAIHWANNWSVSVGQTFSGSNNLNTNQNFNYEQ
jgi:hypothetical protein